MKQRRALADVSRQARIISREAAYRGGSVVSSVALHESLKSAPSPADRSSRRCRWPRLDASIDAVAQPQDDRREHDRGERSDEHADLDVLIAGAAGPEGELADQQRDGEADA